MSEVTDGTAAVEAVRPRPRNDFVIIREETVDMVRGLFMPQVTKEGKRQVVEAVGPKVEDLKVGDVCRIVGEPRSGHWSYLPGFQNLIICREECVVVVYDAVKPGAPKAEPADPAPDIDPESLANPNRG